MSDDRGLSWSTVSGEVERHVRWLDALAGLAPVQELRAAALTALAVPPGATAVDVGSGTGEDVQALAVTVGSQGQAVGVEPQPGLRGVAEHRARAAGSNARFVDGDAAGLPFESGTVHAVRCERVFQHLDRPADAAAELLRVLRPSGRAVVIDMDWGTTLLHPGDAAAAAAAAAALHDDPVNPFAARRVPGQLRQAGLVVDGVQARAWTIWDPTQADWNFISYMIDKARVAARLSETDADRLRADLAAGAARGDFMFSVTMYAVTAHAP